MHDQRNYGTLAAPRSGLSADAVGDATTLMFRHIPRKYTARHLLYILEQHVTKAALDFVYVPWDKNSTSNMGYSFVNFVDSPTARMMAALLAGSIWPHDPRMREMKIMPARVQGLAANLMRYNNDVTEPDLSHCPLVFRKGKEISLQDAIQELLLTNLAAPQWDSKDNTMKLLPKPMKLLPKPTAVDRNIPLPPGLYEEDTPSVDFETWYPDTSTDGSLPALGQGCPGYTSLADERFGGSYQPESLNFACRGGKLDPMTCASTTSTASTRTGASMSCRVLSGGKLDPMTCASTTSTASTRTGASMSCRLLSGGELDFSTCPSSASSTPTTTAWQPGPSHNDAVYESPKYTAAGLKVQDLLLQLQHAGMF